MILYRVSTFTENGNSAGFSWHTKLREAQDAKAEAKANHIDEEREPEIERIEVKLTRDGVLRALNRYASHPDNG